MRDSFPATTAAIKFEEMETHAPAEWDVLCHKFACVFGNLSKLEIADWLGLDINKAASLQDPARFAQVALVVPKVARTMARLAELEELFRLMSDEARMNKLKKLTTAADTFKEGVSKALVKHIDDNDKAFRDITDGLIKFRTDAKPWFDGIRKAYTQIYSVSVAHATHFLSPVHQRKLPSAIPPFGATIKVAAMEGSIQGLYQRLGDKSAEVWALVLPLVTAEIDLLGKNIDGLATELNDAGRALAKM